MSAPMEGVTFSVCTTYRTASAHQDAGKSDHAITVRTRSATMPIRRSTMPFWLLVPALVISCVTSCLSKTDVVAAEAKSGPPSERMNFMCWTPSAPHSLCAFLRKPSSNFEQSLVNLMKNTHVYLLYSSTTSMYPLYPDMESIGCRPLQSTVNRCRYLVAAVCLFECLLRARLRCLSTMQ